MVFDTLPKNLSDKVACNGFAKAYSRSRETSVPDVVNEGGMPSVGE